MMSTPIAAGGDDLPVHIFQVLHRLHVHFFGEHSLEVASSPHYSAELSNLEDEYLAKLLQVYERILQHDSFTPMHKHWVSMYRRVLKRHAQEKGIHLFQSGGNSSSYRSSSTSNFNANRSVGGGTQRSSNAHHAATSSSSSYQHRHNHTLVSRGHWSSQPPPPLPLMGYQRPSYPSSLHQQHYPSMLDAPQPAPIRLLHRRQTSPANLVPAASSIASASATSSSSCSSSSPASPPAIPPLSEQQLLQAAAIVAGGANAPMSSPSPTSYQAQLLLNMLRSEQFRQILQQQQQLSSGMGDGHQGNANGKSSRSASTQTASIPPPASMYERPTFSYPAQRQQPAKAFPLNDVYQQYQSANKFAAFDLQEQRDREQREREQTTWANWPPRDAAVDGIGKSVSQLTLGADATASAPRAASPGLTVYRFEELSSTPSAVGHFPVQMLFSSYYSPPATATTPAPTAVDGGMMSRQKPVNGRDSWEVNAVH